MNIIKKICFYIISEDIRRIENKNIKDKEEADLRIKKMIHRIRDWRRGVGMTGKEVNTFEKADKTIQKICDNIY